MKILQLLYLLTFVAGCIAQSSDISGSPVVSLVASSSAVASSAPSSVVAQSPSVSAVSSLPTSAVSSPSSSSPVPGNNYLNNCSFYDNFVFAGENAVTLNRAGNIFTTVFWDADSWNTRSDSAFGSVIGAIEGNVVDAYGIPRGYGSHEDIHRSFSSLPTDGKVSNAFNAVGGDFGPGIGVLQVDYLTTASARLRNTLLISDTTPGVVEFYTSLFVTKGQFWQVSITPASKSVVGAEFTVEPSVFDSGCQNDQLTTCPAGPGLRPAEDSINVIAIGTSENGCNQPAWYSKFLVQKTVNGNKEESNLPVDLTNPSPNPSYLYPTTSQNTTTLIKVQIRYYTNRIEIWATINSTALVLLQTHGTVTIPWDEVNVHLIGTAFEAEQTPQPICWASKIREIYWKNFKAYPLKYSTVQIWPKTAMVARNSGLTGFDIRSFDYSGIEPYNNRINVNEKKYNFENCTYKCYAYCSGHSWCTTSFVPEGSYVEIPMQLPPSPSPSSIVKVKMVYDIRNYKCSQITNLGDLVRVGYSDSLSSTVSQTSPSSSSVAAPVATSTAIPDNNNSTSSNETSSSVASPQPTSSSSPSPSSSSSGYPWTTNSEFYRMLPNGAGWKRTGLLYHGNVECSALNRTGNVSVAFNNDNDYMDLPGGETINYYLTHGTAGEQWVQRSIEIPLSKLNLLSTSSSNSFRMRFQGKVLIDRIHFEFSYGCQGEITTPVITPVSAVPSSLRTATASVSASSVSGTAQPTKSATVTKTSGAVPTRDSNSNNTSFGVTLTFSNALVAVMAMFAALFATRF